MEESAVRALIGVHPHFLETSFAAIRSKHGSVEGYAQEVLGVTPQLRENLIERLVE